MTFGELVERFGGVMSTRQLIASGETAATIRAAVDDGVLEHLRHGWYAAKDADPPVVAAVRDQCVVSCVDALARHGLWVPEGVGGPHKRVTRHERRRSNDRCRRYGRPTPVVGVIDDVATALQYSARCLDEEGFVIVCDSALQNGKLTPDELRTAFAHAPNRIRRAVAKCDRRSGSGTETAVRLRSRAAGMRVEVQHEVPGVGFVDLLIGDRIALELDSRAYHTGEVNYESDRVRDAELVARSYVPLHFTYAQVFHTWPQTYARLQRIVRDERHRGRGRRTNPRLRAV